MSLGSDTPQANDASHSNATSSIDEQRTTIVRGDAVGGDKVLGDKNVYVYATEEAYDVRNLPNPYRGLAAFSYNQCHLYAGREGSVTDALSLLVTPGEQRTLLFVTGVSGSGKSSFAQAGLAPALAQYYADRTIAVRGPAVITPSRWPLARLADVLVQLGLPSPADADLNTATLVQHIQAHTPQGSVNVVVLDQFEELFTQSETVQRDALLAALEVLPPFTALRTHIIATLRADYLPELFERRVLYELAKQGVDLRAMNERQLQDAILRPLQVTQPAKRFEDKLLTALVRDAAGNASFLPLLQVTLEDLWQRGSLVYAAYNGLGAAIEQRADEVCRYRDYAGARQQERGPDDRAAILGIFLDLVEVSLDDNPRRDVRRRRRLDELTHKQPLRRALIDELSYARLLSISLEQHDGAEVQLVDIIHESLILNWGQLQEAIATRRRELQQRVRFEYALRDWRREPERLLVGVDLAEAEELRRRSDVALEARVAQEFLERSLARRDAEQRRQVRRARVVASSLAVLTALAVIGAIVATFFGLRAQLGERIAQAERLAAQSQLARARTPQLSVLLALEALATTRSVDGFHVPAAEQALFDSLAQIGGQSLGGHTGPIWLALFSPDGQHLITGSEDHSLRLWDLSVYPATSRLVGAYDHPVRNGAWSREGRFVVAGDDQGAALVWDLSRTPPAARPLAEQLGVLYGAEFSPDGRLLATANGDGTVRLYDMTTPDAPTLTRTLRLDGFPGALSQVVFSPDGLRLAAGSYDHVAALWNLTSDGLEPPVQLLRGHEGAVHKVLFSPDGTRLVTAGFDGVVRVWSIGPEGQAQEAAVLRRHTGLIYAAAISPDSRWLATGGEDRTVLLWDLNAANLTASMHVLRGHVQSIEALAFSPDGAWLASGSDDTSVRLWDVSSKDPAMRPRVLRGHDNAVLTLAFSSDSAHLATGAYDSSARLWELADDRLLANPMLLFRSAMVHALAFCPIASKRLVIGDADGALHILDGAIAISGTVAAPTGAAVSAIACGPSDGLLTTIGADASVRVHSVTDGRELGRVALREPIGSVLTVAISSDGQYMATGGVDGVVRVWSLAGPTSGSLMAELRGHSNAVEALAFSPDHSRLASGGRDFRVVLWDLKASDPNTTALELKDHSDVVRALAFSFDGAQLASGGGDAKVHVWRIGSTGHISLQHVFAGHTQSVAAVAFSPDGKRLASGSWDDSIRLWDLSAANTTAQSLVLRAHAANVQSLAFDYDSSTLVASGADGNLYLWRLEFDQVVALACKVVGRNLTDTEWRQFFETQPYRHTCALVIKHSGVRGELRAHVSYHRRFV